MKSFFLIMGAVVYTLLGVVTFRTFDERFVCLQSPVNRAMASTIYGVMWPVAVIASGSMVILFNIPDVWKCGPR